MTTSQVERSIDKPAVPEPTRYAPAIDPESKAVFDLLARDTTDNESPIIRMAVTILTWSVAVIALVAVAALTWQMLRGS